MKWGRKQFLLLGIGVLLFMTACPVYVFRTPRVAVDVVRVRNCVGRQWTYFCRRPNGHIRIRKITCYRFGRAYVQRRRWFIFDGRCAHHAFIGEAPPPADAPPADGPADGPPPVDNP